MFKVNLLAIIHLFTALISPFILYLGLICYNLVKYDMCH